jgi:cobyrinic acid a,c-diamide synthase
MQKIPRLLIAGTQSGVGKSTISLALIAAMKRRGLQVQTFKVGPDYLDPGHLAQVSGRPCYNLDSWICPADYLSELFVQAGADADICIVEGVMGLFDGSSSTGLSGSSAEIAALLDIPILLVVNSHGMARSFAAMINGYHNFEPGVQVAGVLANRSGSQRHSELLTAALEHSGLPPLLGAIPRDGLPQLKSRHLGLVSAAEQGLGSALIQHLADAAEQYIAIDQLLDRAAQAASKSGASHAPIEPVGENKLRLGVARDEAFLFYYPDLFPALEKRGCQPVFFSPLHDDDLPSDLDGLYFGGGYPEVYARQLSENTRMCAAVNEFCRTDRPVYAECGGLIYLSRGLEDGAGFIPLVGQLPTRVQMLDKRKALGYVTVTLGANSLFGTKGTKFRGHEFHYSELTDDPVGIDGWQSVYRLQQNRSGAFTAEGYQRGNILASYAHLHLASNPQALDYFVALLNKAKDPL